MGILSSTIFAELERGGLFSKDGDRWRLLSDYRAFNHSMLAYERELGMTPAARMAIKANGKDTALDVVASMNAQREAEETAPEPVEQADGVWTAVPDGKRRRDGG